MKTTKATQSFKAVRATMVDRIPELADRVGKKRDSVEFELPCYEVADLPELTSQHAQLLLDCFNGAFANLAKDLFAANPANWSYVPTLADLSPAALAASFEKTSRSRILTLESAGKLAAWLTKNLGKVVAGIQKVEPTYQAAQLSAIIVVISKFNAYEAKGADYLAKVLMRLEQIAAAIVDDEELASSYIEDTTLPAVFDALVNKFTKVGEEEIDADAL